MGKTKHFTHPWQLLSVNCLSQILLVVTSKACNLKKKSTNYLNQSAIECTFQWLVLRFLSQQCFPRVKSPKEHVRGSLSREVNSAENLHAVIELPGMFET